MLHGPTLAAEEDEAVHSRRVCPAHLVSAQVLLVSTLQETQRFRTTHAVIREVISNTSISTGGKDYMLRKGNYVQLHGPPVLRSKDLW
ncbi:hypothetical protein diail_2568 [Diaporthe ilicicola]|nr:hypothetical protein diail_2568 [Diaporthe ilicicola]